MSDQQNDQQDSTTSAAIEAGNSTQAEVNDGAPSLAMWTYDQDEELWLLIVDEKNQIAWRDFGHDEGKFKMDKYNAETAGSVLGDASNILLLSIIAAGCVLLLLAGGFLVMEKLAEAFGTLDPAYARLGIPGVIGLSAVWLGFLITLISQLRRLSQETEPQTMPMEVAISDNRVRIGNEVSRLDRPAWLIQGPTTFVRLERMVTREQIVGSFGMFYYDFRQYIDIPVPGHAAEEAIKVVNHLNKRTSSLTPYSFVPTPLELPRPHWMRRVVAAGMLLLLFAPALFLLRQ